MKKFLFFLLIPSLLFAETPPAGSRAANGVWPRLIITPENRTTIRTYINSNYSSQFQTFLNLLNTGIESEGDVTSEKQIENAWGPLNYAFPVALGVTELRALGYTMPSNYDGSGETADATLRANLCQKSYDYFVTDTPAYPVGSPTVCTGSKPCRSIKYMLENWPEWQAAGAPQHGTSSSITTYTGRDNALAAANAIWISGVLAFDWCHAEWSSAQKQTVANAFYEHYSEMWSSQNLLTTTIWGDAYVTNRFGQSADDLLFALTAWGDTDILDATKRQTLYDAFYSIWINRFIWEMNQTVSNGWNHWGGADYWKYVGNLTLNPPIAVIDTALGTTYSSSIKYFSEQGLGLAAWTWPENTNKTTGCGTAGNSGCPPYVESWGYNTYTVGPAGGTPCRAAMMAVGFNRFMGSILNNANLTADAAKGRWVYDNFNSRTVGCAADTRNSSTITTSYWANAVFKFFLFGAEGISASVPTETDIQLGLGYKIFRSSGNHNGTPAKWTVNDTFIWFGGQTLITGGHDSKEPGNFVLHKFGPLIVKAGNVREGNCVVSTTENGELRRTLLQNTVNLHKGASDLQLSYDKALSTDPDYLARGQSGVYYTFGSTTSSSGSSYSYTTYDAGALWATASKMQRDFVYLRGDTDHEYIVIYDRANVSDTINDPIWKIWVTQQPACVDSTCSAGFTGQWTTTGKIVSVTNQKTYSGNIGSVGGESVNLTGFHVPVTSGKFFLKAVLPVDATIQMLGDDGTATKFYHDGNASGSVLTTTSGCTTKHSDIYGWGRIEVRPGTVQNNNVFVNIIQFGNATTLQEMTPIQSAYNFGPGLEAIQIDDSNLPKLVAFVNTAEQSYWYSTRAEKTEHFVVGLEPGKTYFVSSSNDFSLALVYSPILILAWPRIRSRTKIGIVIVCILFVFLILIPSRYSRIQISPSFSPGSVSYTTDSAGLLNFVTGE